MSVKLGRLHSITDDSTLVQARVHNDRPKPRTSTQVPVCCA